MEMGWVEFPPFFCAASETARDVAQDYCETELGTLPPHKFTHYVTGNHAYAELPETDPTGRPFRYLLEVYVDDFVSLVIPTSREQLRHVSTDLRDHECNRPNVVGKDEDYCCRRCVNIL